MKMARKLVAIGLAWLCLAAGSGARAENVGCMVYNNGLRFTEEELERLVASDEIQYVGVTDVHGDQPHYREVATRLARSGKKIVLQIWWGSWSRFAIANIALDPKIRADFFREVVDPLIDSIGPQHIHAAHMLEETAMQFATDEQEPGEPENLLDGGGGGYESPYYSGYGWDRGGRYGGPWILSLRRHNEDFRRFSGYSLFEAAVWQQPDSIFKPKTPQFGAFRRWVGQRVQALANNHFADHLHEKYPGILATTWDGPNFGGVTWADTPAMLNSIDGFTSNVYIDPLRTYIRARSLRTLDYDKELQFMSWVGYKNPDVNARNTMLTTIYAVGSNIVHLWEEPRRSYKDLDKWKMMKSQYGALSKLPVFRHSPDVFLICGPWGVPSDHLKNFDASLEYDAVAIGLGRYKLVLAYGAGHAQLKDYVANGGLAVVFRRVPSFLQEEGILVPEGGPVELSGTCEPDDWWRGRFGLAESYELRLKPGPAFSAGKGVHQIGGSAYHVSYGKGEMLVLPGHPANEGPDSGWARFVYDLIKGLLHANGMPQVFDKHFAPWESGGRYIQITSDDGSVTCTFHYDVVMPPQVPPVQVKGIDIFTGQKDPVLSAKFSAAIVAHAPPRPWSPPPFPDREAILVKPTPKEGRRGLPELPELAPGHSLGPARAALEPGTPPTWVAAKSFEDWAAAEAHCRVIINFKPTDAAVDGQPLVLSGKQVYELTGWADLSWDSVRVFDQRGELPVQVDERDGTGHYKADGNGRIDIDDELVFAVSVPAGAPSTYHLYCDSRAAARPPSRAADVKFEQISTDIADAVFGNGRLTAHLKGPARQPGEGVVFGDRGAGAITDCSLDGQRFTRFRQDGSCFFSHPWSEDGGWTKPERIISGPLRTIVRMRIPETIRRDKAKRKTFEGQVTNYFAMYGAVPVLDLEQRIEYRWSAKNWSAAYGFDGAVGEGPDAKDVLFVPLEGEPQRVSMDVEPDRRAYREHRPEAGWMAMLDPRQKHGWALFYARIPEVRENLAWVDYSPRRELTPSVKRNPPPHDGYPMTLRYSNRVMQTDDVITRSFRVVGLTQEDGPAVAAQYRVWGEELTRLARVEVQMRE